jgi:hypothetical protein
MFMTCLFGFKKVEHDPVINQWKFILTRPLTRARNISKVIFDGNRKQNSLVEGQNIKKHICWYCTIT